MWASFNRKGEDERGVAIYVELCGPVNLHYDRLVPAAGPRISRSNAIEIVN